MYFKTFNIDKRDNMLEKEKSINKDNILQSLQEAQYIKKVEKIKEGFYGRDAEDNFFLVKIISSDTNTSIEVQLESDDYELMRNLSDVIAKDNKKIEDTPVENLFSFVRIISEDVKVIKNIMVFYLVISIIGFILTILIGLS